MDYRKLISDFCEKYGFVKSWRQRQFLDLVGMLKFTLDDHREIFDNINLTQLEEDSLVDVVTNDWESYDVQGKNERKYLKQLWEEIYKELNENTVPDSTRAAIYIAIYAKSTEDSRLTSNNWNVVDSVLQKFFRCCEDLGFDATSPQSVENTSIQDTQRHLNIKELSRGLCDIPDSLIDLLPSPTLPNQQEEIMESRILPLLGLPEDASEAEVFQAVKDLKDKLIVAENKLLQIEADDFISQNRERISDAEGFKRLYITHGKEVAKAFLQAITDSRSSMEDATVKEAESGVRMADPIYT